MSSSNIPDAELVAMAADIPLLIGGSVMIDAMDASGTTVDANWHESAGATERNLSDSPPTLAYDGFHHAVTLPDVVTNPGRTEWFYDIDLGAAFEFDCLAYLQHNWDTEGVTLATFSVTNASFLLPTIISSISSFPDGRRLVELDLSDTTDPKRWTERYLQLHLTGPANFEPSLGELWLGRRHQLLAHPSLPYDTDGEATTQDMRDSESGVISAFNFATRRKIITLPYNIAETDTVDELIAWWVATGGNARGSLVIPRPTEDKQNAYVMWAPPNARFDFPFVGPFERRLNMTLRESAPLVSGES